MATYKGIAEVDRESKWFSFFLVSYFLFILLACFFFTSYLLTLSFIIATWYLVSGAWYLVFRSKFRLLDI